MSEGTASAANDVDDANSAAHANDAHRILIRMNPPNGWPATTCRAVPFSRWHWLPQATPFEYARSPRIRAASKVNFGSKGVTRYFLDHRGKAPCPRQWAQCSAPKPCTRP